MRVENAESLVPTSADSCLSLGERPCVSAGEGMIRY